jgi:guanine nucleotide-binding protein subunit alpha
MGEDNSTGCISIDNVLQRFAELIFSDPDIGPNEPMPIDCLNAFRSLWNDAGVQAAISKGNKYALHDNLS